MLGVLRRRVAWPGAALVRRARAKAKFGVEGRKEGLHGNAKHSSPNAGLGRGYSYELDCFFSLSCQLFCQFSDTFTGARPFSARAGSTDSPHSTNTVSIAVETSTRALPNGSAQAQRDGSGAAAKFGVEIAAISDLCITLARRWANDSYYSFDKKRGRYQSYIPF